MAEIAREPDIVVYQEDSSLVNDAIKAVIPGEPEEVAKLFAGGLLSRPDQVADTWQFPEDVSRPDWDPAGREALEARLAFVRAAAHVLGYEVVRKTTGEADG